MRKSLLDQADDHVRQAIEAATRSGAKSIPDIRTLARNAGVSLGTMSKAVRRFRESGELLCVPGSGTYVARTAGGPRTQPCAPTVSRTHAKTGYPWQGAYGEMVGRLRNGRYPPGTVLPSLKTLRAELGVSYPTLRKALDELRNRGIIQAHGRSYRVISPPSHGFRHSIALVAGGLSPHGICIVDFERVTHDLRAIEKECRNRGVNLTIVVQNMTEGDYRFYLNGRHVDLTAGFLTRHAFLGCIVCNLNMDADAARVTYERARHLRAPVVIYDVSAGEVAPDARFFPVIRTEALGDTCGRKVGQYLIALGHKRIAYIAPEKAQWSRSRLRGLGGAAEDSVEDVTIHECGEDRYVQLTGGEQRYVESVLPAFRAVLAKNEDRFSALLARSLSVRQREMNAFVLRQQGYEHDCRCFEQALRLKGVTAWVCHNDPVALNALRFLRSKSIAVPDQLSIVGFDDVFESCEHRLTTYSFNPEALAQSLVSTALDGPSHLKVPRDAASIIEGYVVERNTAATWRKGEPESALAVRSAPARRNR